MKTRSTPVQSALDEATSAQYSVGRVLEHIERYRSEGSREKGLPDEIDEKIMLAMKAIQELRAVLSQSW